MRKWEFWIDRGGTFTDYRAAARGNARALKLLSENPEPIATPRSRASADCLGHAPTTPIPGQRIGAVKMGTTVATNALLERKGDRTLLAHHRGLPRRAADRLPGPAADFRQAHRQPEMLYERVVEVDERVLADGKVERVLDLDGVHAELRGQD